GDLARQKDTATIILAENKHCAPPLEELHGLREWRMGGFEGGLVTDLWIPLFREHSLDDSGIAGGFKALERMIGLQGIADAIAGRDPSRTAEDFNSIAERTHGAIDHIAATTLAGGGGNALAVTSGMTIRSIMKLYVPDVQGVLRVPNCSLTILRYADGKFALLQSADVGYCALADESP
ncbi:MAG: histidine phosphatase family protein, partial [Deltaproteobacteria bacterium]|nr:histidine phosphatase family protein [Deltaproteobacteria bacterium]